MKSLIQFLLVLFLGIQVQLKAQAQVIAPSAKEVLFSFQSMVVASPDSGYSAQELAEFQASYIFGIFSSAENIKIYGLKPELVGGLGVPKKEMNIRILSETEVDGKIQVKYQSSGTFLLHNKVAAKLLDKGTVSVPFPMEPLEVFDPKCTDPHYDSFPDFWYFYDPFRKGCEYLSKAPYAFNVDIKIKAGAKAKQEAKPRLDLLRGDNGNGSIFSIYVIHGYYESSIDPRDDGRKAFQDYNAFLRGLGFNEKSLRENTTWPMTEFTATMTLQNGKDIDIVIRHALVESGAESRNVYFAKFFKEAVENGDVVVYTGHSGLGSNLDIPTLEYKAGKFNFPRNKRQIFFFESCASYAYYLDTFKYEKTRATIDVVTNGLSSYFETSHDLLTIFTAHMLNPLNEQVTWLKILQDMESPLEGGSYLTNVGGL